MQIVQDIKKYLDNLRESEASNVLAEGWYLGVPGLSEEDCQQIERYLNIQLPESYRSLIQNYDWRFVEFGYLKIFATSDQLIKKNTTSVNPFFEFYRANDLFEIGHYEADRLCIKLSNNRGEVVFVDETRFPDMVTEFVASNFERLCVCATVDLQLKMQADYFNWSDEQLAQDQETLFAQILTAISEVEPKASNTSFWNRFVRGF